MVGNTYVDGLMFGEAYEGIDSMIRMRLIMILSLFDLAISKIAILDLFEAISKYLNR